MQEPLFRVGDLVRRSAERPIGKVESIINKNDKEDQRKQGYRYEVSFPGNFTESIPEASLVPGTRKPKGDYSSREEKHVPEDI